MGLHDQLILEIFRAKSDWEFIIKVDAMLEAAAKAVVKQQLIRQQQVVRLYHLMGLSTPMPMNGRTSLLAFLKADGCQNEVFSFIERSDDYVTASAIHVTDAKLSKSSEPANKSQLIKSLCQIEEYNEAALIKDYEKDGGFLRLCDCRCDTAVPDNVVRHH